MKPVVCLILILEKPKMIMENSTINYPRTMVKTTRIKNSVYYNKIPDRGTNNKNLFKSLSKDGCEDFFNYLDWLDLAKSTEVIILPRKGSFYYAPEDFQNTETVINLKPINFIKNLKSFISKIYSFLPEYSFFAGCFEEHKGNYGNRQSEGVYDIGSGSINNSSNKSPWLLNWTNRLFNYGPHSLIDRKSAKSVLELSGFTVLDITTLNGKTYFCAQKRTKEENKQ